MFLRSIKYNQFSKTSRNWQVEDFSIGRINLIVGKNATGKTRTLNIIKGLANLLCGNQKLNYMSGNYEVCFNKENSVIKYILVYENTEIIKEELWVDERRLLQRGLGGEGLIYAAELKQDMKFQVPVNQLACVSRRDSLQHPFFEDLYKWGELTVHYDFGSPMGKDHFEIFSKDSSQKKKNINLKRTQEVVTIFKDGIEKYGQKFIDLVISEMEQVGYKLESVGIIPLENAKIESDIAGVQGVLGLYVKEKDLVCKTEQYEMSQGMFRVLSLISQLCYSQLENLPICILIDDIGEGLDYERSTALIYLLVNKAKSSTIQLIMTTNDRFVMNHVPLEYWQVIQRKGSLIKMFNYENSKKVFDEFEFTGLANFDFLSSEFYLKDQD